MYTIKVKEPHKMYLLKGRLNQRTEESRFTATFEQVSDDTIHVKPVRLKESKPYCGQHPGECQVGLFGPRKKRSGRWLEWDDWVEFHALVNDACDSLELDADIWTNPIDALDKGKKMWVRRGLQRRVRYEWDARWNGMREDRIWNHGTQDQFQ